MRFTKEAVLAGIVLFSSGYMGLSYYGAYRATPVVAQTIAKFQDIASVQYKKITFSPLTQQVKLHDVKIMSPKEEQLFAKMETFSIKLRYENKRFTHVSGNIKHLRLSFSPKEDATITYSYEFIPEKQTAAIQIEGQSTSWGNAKAHLELAHFKPSLDLLFGYPSVQISQALMEFHDKALVTQVLALLNQPTVAPPESLYLSFTPQKAVNLAELKDNFPDNLVSNSEFKVKSKPEQFSRMAWLEKYLTKIKQEFFG
jgi:hypothetical protein